MKRVGRGNPGGICTLFSASILAVALMATIAQADPVPATALDLNGTVNTGLCSAALVDLEKTDDAPAYVLSAGHCPEYPQFVAPGKAYEIDQNQWPNTNGYPLGSTLDQPSHLEITRMIYATMTNTDVSLYETKSTVGELKKAGYRIFEISNRLPDPGATLTVTSAYWKQTQTCIVDRILRSNQDETEIDPTPMNGYQFRNSIFFNAECRIRSGWSGSPVFDDQEGKIYGVVSRYIRAFNTPKMSLTNGNVDLMRFIGFKATTPDTGVLVASNMPDLHNCLGPDGKLALDQKGCELPKLDPTAVPVQPAPRPETPSSSGSLWPKPKVKRQVLM